MKKLISKIGTNVTNCRVRAGMSVQEVSQATKIPGSILSGLEKGDISYLTIESMSDIADVLGVSLADLTSGVPKSTLNNNLFNIEVKEAVPGTKYIVRTKDKTYIVRMDTDTRRSSTTYPESTVHTTEGSELPNGALSNALRNIVYGGRQCRRKR